MGVRRVGVLVLSMSINEGETDWGNAPGIISSLSWRDVSLAGSVLGVRVGAASWERDTRLGVVERSRRRALERRAMAGGGFD